MAAAALPPALPHRGDAVEHQHRRQRQLRVALAEEVAAAAGDQLLVVEAGRPLVGRFGLRHRHVVVTNLTSVRKMPLIRALPDTPPRGAGINIVALRSPQEGPLWTAGVCGKPAATLYFCSRQPPA